MNDSKIPYYFDRPMTPPNSRRWYNVELSWLLMFPAKRGRKLGNRAFSATPPGSPRPSSIKITRSLSLPRAGLLR